MVLFLLIAAALATSHTMSGSVTVDSVQTTKQVEALFVAESGIERAARRFTYDAVACTSLGETQSMGSGSFTLTSYTTGFSGSSLNTNSNCRVRSVGTAGSAVRTIESIIGVSNDVSKGGGGKTLTVTVESGDNRILIVGASYHSDGAESITAMKYNGVSMTKLSSYTSSQTVTPAAAISAGALAVTMNENLDSAAFPSSSISGTVYDTNENDGDKFVCSTRNSTTLSGCSASGGNAFKRHNNAATATLRLDHQVTVEFWYMLNPATGTHNVVATSSASEFVMGAMGFSGVDQTTPFESTAQARASTGSSTTPAVSVSTSSTTTNSYAVDIFARSGAGNISMVTTTDRTKTWECSSTGGQNQCGTGGSSTKAGGGASYRSVPAASTTVTQDWNWTATGDPWAQVGTILRATTTGPSAGRRVRPARGSSGWREVVAKP